MLAYFLNNSWTTKTNHFKFCTVINISELSLGSREICTCGWGWGVGIDLDRIDFDRTNLDSCQNARDFGDLPADTYRRDCMPTEIYPYWAGLCCMADNRLAYTAWDRSHYLLYCTVRTRLISQLYEFGNTIAGIWKWIRSTPRLTTRLSNEHYCNEPCHPPTQHVG